MNYLLLALAGIIATIAYGIILKRKPRLKIGMLGNAGDFGDDEQTRTQEQTQTNQYAPETLEARKNWLQVLKDWQTSGDYGATDMNWDEIFDTAQKKISQYYGGSAVSPGLTGKIKASAARRGVSESPAMEEQLTRVGQQQSSDISDLISNLTTQKASYTESARKNWLSSLMGLGNLSPTGQTGTMTTTMPEEEFDWFSPLLGAVGTIAGSAFGPFGSLAGGTAGNWLSNLFKPSVAQSGISNIANNSFATSGLSWS